MCREFVGNVPRITALEESYEEIEKAVDYPHAEDDVEDVSLPFLGEYP